MVDRPETRPEIEPFQWNPKNLQWPVKGKGEPALIFLDPPASPEGEADGGQVPPISKKWQTNMSKRAFDLKCREQSYIKGSDSFLVW